MGSRAFLLAVLLLLLLLPLSNAIQQVAGMLVLRPPHISEAKYLVTTGDESEPKTMIITLSEELRPYISISPSESFDMEPHAAKEVVLRTNYTGDEPIPGLVSVTASPLGGGGGGGGAVISIRLDKPVLLEAYNETMPFQVPELPPEQQQNATRANASAPAAPQPGTPYSPSEYETQIVIEPWVWAAAILILIGIGSYVYLQMRKGGKLGAG